MEKFWDIVILFLLVGWLLESCEHKELEKPILGVENSETCIYTIDKDTIVLGAIMYEIDRFNLQPTIVAN